MCIGHSTLKQLPLTGMYKNLKNVLINYEFTVSNCRTLQHFPDLFLPVLRSNKVKMRVAKLKNAYNLLINGS